MRIKFAVESYPKTFRLNLGVALSLKICGQKSLKILIVMCYHAFTRVNLLYKMELCYRWVDNSTSMVPIDEDYCLSSIQHRKKHGQHSPKFLQPELYFIQKDLAIGGSLSENRTKVSQLVRKGATLADYPTYRQMKKKGFLRSPMEAGEHVDFAEETYSLIATASGYPKIKYIEQENGPDILVITIIPLVDISYNKMQASLIIHPPIPNAPSIKTENLSKLLEEAGVTFGVDNSALEKAQQIISRDIIDFDDIVIANGTYPGEGEDARVQFELEIGPLAGYLLEDGSIDFRDRRIMVGVKQGDRIATKIPAIPGESGYNVLGQKIEPKTGKDVKIRVQGQAKFIAEENRVIATGDGALSIVNMDTIKVAPTLTVSKDVDYSTGNIESEKNALIRGSVQPGFKVDVGGDLKIFGAVSSAEIKGGGNTVIKGGITGTTSLIESRGDVDVNFIERGTIHSGGLVVIRKQCYYSTVKAAVDIRCHKGSTVIGGQLLAGESLTLGNVGADNCEPAMIGAGVDPQRYKLYQELQKEYIEQQEEIIQALQMLGRGGRPKKIKKMEEAAEELKLKLLKLNLIPGTDLYSRVGKGKERDDIDDEDPMYLLEANIENIRIEVHGKMYAGTQIMLGNRSVTLKRDVENRKYRLSKNLKRIMAIPL